METLPPLAEILLGTLLLVFSILLHGLGMYFVQVAFDRYWPKAPEARARRQAVLGALILMMLATHLTELAMWSATLIVTDAVPNLRDAFYFASVTYTTLGYEDIVLPRAWRLLSPMMAVSGLFAFGWSGSVLVSIVTATNPTRKK